MTPNPKLLSSLQTYARARIYGFMCICMYACICVFVCARAHVRMRTHYCVSGPYISKVSRIPLLVYNLQSFRYRKKVYAPASNIELIWNHYQILHWGNYLHCICGCDERNKVKLGCNFHPPVFMWTSVGCGIYAERWWGKVLFLTSKWRMFSILDIKLLLYGMKR